MLKTTLNKTALPVCLAAGVVAAPVFSQAPQFEAPVRLKAAGEYIKTESPGFAAPCWADVDGDGKKDLVVGQFAGGKMKIYRNLGDGKLAKGEWLKAEGEIAEVPGVW
ncbi:MAG: FG-GAP repeat domain-containing protein [Planctomycetota bacterium]|jgi:hypothetical protein